MKDCLRASSVEGLDKLETVDPTCGRIRRLDLIAMVEFRVFQSVGPYSFAALMA